MGMVEIRERTTVKEADGSEKVLLPGRITQAEADQYGISAPVEAKAAPAAEEAPAPAPKSRKKT